MDEFTPTPEQLDEYRSKIFTAYQKTTLDVLERIAVALEAQCKRDLIYLPERKRVHVSADNYYRVCQHPDGNHFTFVMGMGDDIPTPMLASPKFATVRQAYEAASERYSEYGVSIDPWLLP